MNILGILERVMENVTIRMPECQNIKTSGSDREPKYQTLEDIHALFILIYELILCCLFIGHH